MQEDTRIKAQQSSALPTDQLWTWNFSAIDWICMAIASVLFFAYLAFLFSTPAIVERSGMVSSAPLFSVLIISAALIVKPKSNTTRIPAVYIILLSAGAIAINWSLL